MPADNPTSRTRFETIDVNGQRLRVGVRPRKGTDGPTLLLMNGIGANLELFRPFVDEIADEGIEVAGFDVPGVGGSPTPAVPYRLSGIARLAARTIDELGYGQVDVLGVSWGGALAQQFAHQYPERCRRLVLASTSMGAVAVPGKPSALAKMVTPRRYLDPSYMEEVGPDLYGGKVRENPDLAREFAAAMSSGGGKGYLYQLSAITGWTSVRWLRKLYQPTLIIAGSEDPIVPLTNAKLMARLIPDSRLHVVDDGHLALLTSAKELAPVVERFLLEDGGRGGKHDRR